MASAITPSSQNLTHPSSATAQTKTYLNRCIEDLSADKVTRFEKKATRWKIAFVVSTVAFIALAIGAFIATSLLAVAYMPVAGLSAILLAMMAAPQIQKLKEWSQDATDEAVKYKRIQHHYADLTRQTPEQLQHLLAQMGIIGSQGNLTRLTPLLARAKYLEERTQYWTGLRDKDVNDATAAEQPKKNTLCYNALQNEDQALFAKILNAFTNAVLRNPDFKGSLADVATLSKNNYYDSILSNALGDPSSNTVLTFKKGNLSPLSFNDVKTMDVPQLGQRIFTAMTAT
jgi:hypothetical protein